MLDVQIDHLHRGIENRKNIEKLVHLYSNVNALLLLRNVFTHPVPILFDYTQHNRHFAEDIYTDEWLNIFENDISMLHKNHKSHPSSTSLKTKDAFI